MAAEQAGADASPGSAGPAEAGDTPSGAEAPAPGGQPGLDEVKRKYREVLDRKRRAQASQNAEGAQGTGKVHGSHGPAASRRSFRRKSGG